jgi:hypothetical protein
VEEKKGPAAPSAFIWRNMEVGGERTTRMKRMMANRAEEERKKFTAVFTAQQKKAWDLQTEMLKFLLPKVQEERMGGLSQKLAELHG